MEEKVVIKKMNKWVLKIMTDVIFLLLLFGLMIIVILHTILPFFPFLLLFDFCIIIGYPLFLRYILQRKWFECVKDYYLQTKYILLPNVVGMTVDEAKKTLKGLKIEYTGSGEKVIEQVPEANQYIKETNTIKLMLK